MTTPSTDHEARGEAKLLEQFKRSPVLKAILKSYLKQIQKFENACWEVITIRGIANSVGVGLDQIGRIVKRARLGLSDADYRLALRAQIRINRSSGTPEDLIAVTGLSIPDGTDFDYDEYYPATALITIPGGASFNIPLLYGNLQRAKAGGVALFLVYSSAPVAETFAFSSVPSTVVVDPSRGFGGGKLAKVI